MLIFEIYVVKKRKLCASFLFFTWYNILFLIIYRIGAAYASQFASVLLVK